MMLWTMKDGRTIPVIEMSERHFNNTVAMLKRKSDRLHHEALCGIGHGLNPDGMGAYYAEQQGFENLDEALALDARIQAMLAERAKGATKIGEGA